MNYYEMYKSKLVTPDEAVKCISPTDTLGVGYGDTEPPALLTSLAKRAKTGDLQSINVYYLHSSRSIFDTIFAMDLLSIFHPRPMTGLKSEDRALLEKAHKDGLIEDLPIVPCNFSETPRFFKENIELDTFILTVSPMDKAGFFSLGIANAYNLVAARNCKNLLFEVNKNMPRVFGNSMLHISEATAIVENDIPLPEAEISLSAPTEEVDEITKKVIELIPNGATLQLGFGVVPNAICKSLENHKDLGIHSELLSPSLIDLIEKGVVNGKKKSIHPHKHLFTTCMGNKRYYDFINDNPSIESYPVSYINDPCVIAQNDNLISVNSILQIDLFGQANADIIGGVTLSGPGGQNDFVRGAYASKGGKSILAFKSTAKHGKLSRIVPKADFVTDNRMDVQYVITEYGMVNLKGKTVAERARVLIEITHPDFRQQLYDAAKKMKLIY